MMNNFNVINAVFKFPFFEISINLYALFIFLQLFFAIISTPSSTTSLHGFIRIVCITSPKILQYMYPVS